MSCKFCGKPCSSACLPLEQARVKSFPTIFDPTYARERQARGYAMIVKAFLIKEYEQPLIDNLNKFAIAVAGKKTVARAMELLDDPFVTEIAERMAQKAFKERESPLFQKEIEA